MAANLSLPWLISAIHDNGNDLLLNYVSPIFKPPKSNRPDDATKQAIIDEVIDTGSCQQIENLPQEIKDTFVVPSDITAEEHIQMQAVSGVSGQPQQDYQFPTTATPTMSHRLICSPGSWAVRASRSM